MNVKRFSARTSRDALQLVRQAFGEDAVVLSTRPCAEGVEVMAMAPDSVQQIERVAAEAAAGGSAPCRRAAAAAAPTGGALVRDARTTPSPPRPRPRPRSSRTWPSCR